MSSSLQPQWTAALQASLSITNSRSLLKLMSIKSVMPSNHLILCHPLLLLPSIFPSIRVFSSESVLVRMSIIKKSANNKCWRGCGEKGPLLHCWWECKLIQSLWKTVCYAKSLQSCPTLCDPIDGSPPGSPVPGILQARTLEWVTISFSSA